MIHKAFNGEMLTNEMYQTLLTAIQGLQGKVEGLEERVKVLSYENSELRSENAHLKRASSYRGSEAVYGMLARREEKKVRGPVPA